MSVPVGYALDKCKRSLHVFFGTALCVLSILGAYFIAKGDFFHSVERSALEFLKMTIANYGTVSVEPQQESRLRSTLPEVAPGTYYALVIGNNRYEHLPNLKYAAEDARAISEVLQEHYGFEVMTLLDATRYEVFASLNSLLQILTERDAFLVFYAGHGTFDDVNLRGHWLPVDAEHNSSANWISNVSLTDIFNVISAKHVLVLADTCYSGSLANSAIGPLQADMSGGWRGTELIALSGKRSRTVMTAGRINPVLDGGGNKHSVFTQAIIDILTSNQDLLGGRQFFDRVRAMMGYAAHRLPIDQVPTYSRIAYTGHEAGDFSFVPKLNR